MSSNRSWHRWAAVRGYNTRDTPQVLPDWLATVCTNVELQPGCLGRRRPSTVAIGLTSGPTTLVYFLYRHATTSATQLWAFDESGAGSSLAAYVYTVAGGWSSTSLTDTPAAGSTAYPVAASLNNKLFLCYDNSVNRLHCYDGTSWRRVGLGVPSAPTAADGGGGGAYAATARRYRVQFYIKSSSTYVAVSELSSAVSFTPSGVNANATVTKPTTVDSATHWAVFGLISTSGDTYDSYVKISSDIVVGTTTFADTTAPASYSGDAPSQLGLNIPPPSAKYIISDGNRLLMAGAFESSASSGQTVPMNSRVWMTRVLGSSDLGDDETIPNTTTLKLWIDCGENDGDEIVGLGGPIDGIVFVFKRRSIWRLTPTGIDTVPYRAEVVTRSVGAVVTGTPTAANQHNIVLAETDTGQPVGYFMARKGAYRISPSTGLEYLGWDISSETTGAGPVCQCGIWNSTKRQVWWVEGNSTTLHVYTPQLAVQDESGQWRGGWSKYTLPSTSEVTFLAMFEATGMVGSYFPTVANRINSSPRVQYFGATTADDVNGSYSPTVTSKPFQLASGIANVTLDDPSIEAVCETGATPSMSYVLDYGRETRTATAPSLAASGSETRKRVTVGGLQGSDAAAVAITLTWDSDQTARMDAVLVPYKPQESVS